MATTHDYLGPYRLIRTLNYGKFCEVLEAKKDGPNEPRVVVKVIKDEFQKARDQIANLKHEYEAGKDMNHPNIIKVHELVIPSDAPAYLVMEYFDAPNLKQVIWQGEEWVTPLLPKIVEEAAEGMAYFHRKGWVHCDVKPDNFLVSHTPETKLIDFSIAQRVGKGGGGLSALFGRRGHVKGTRSYMSPEQIRGKSLDERSDVYSFGCMMFQLFGGKMPFTGENSDDLLNKHLKAPVPSLLAANSDVHPDLAALVERMMQKSPKQRPTNMAMFLREYQQIRIYKTRRRPDESAAKSKKDA